MRLQKIHVDGYGVLSGADLGPLPRGLSIILGPNEAGKSTLLDFLRGMLFGFPDRRHRAPFHTPIRGGRHGGTLDIEDARGGAWHLERYLDARTPVLYGPDGSVQGESALRELLGNADDSVFRAIFAFGLGELMNFETLDRDEVKDLVFSAGVLGAGRSATRVMRTLEQQREAIVRPRQQDVLANRLRREIDDIDRRLREARADSGAYASATKAAREAGVTAEAIRRESDQLHRRAQELTRLESCWAPWRQRVEATTSLAALGEVSTPHGQLLQAAGEIRRLESELSGYEQRCLATANMQSQLRGIERELEQRLAEIGVESRSRVLPPLDLGLEEKVEDLAGRRRELEAVCRTREEQLNGVRREQAELTDQLSAATVAAGGPRETGALEELARDGQQLREMLSTLDRLEVDELRRNETRALATGRDRDAGRRRLPLAVTAVLAVVGIAATVVSALASRRDPSFTLAGAGLVICAVVAMLWLVRGRTAPIPALTDDTAASQRIERVRDEIAGLASHFTLPDRPEESELAHALDAIEGEREHRRKLDELSRTRYAVSRRVADAEASLANALDELTALDEEVRRIAEKLELNCKTRPEALVRAIAAMRAAAGLIAASERVAPELAAFKKELSEYETRLGQQFARIGRSPRAGESTKEMVNALIEDLDTAVAADHKRTQLSEAMTTAERTVDEALGDGPDGGRLRAELESGAVLVWEEEHRKLRGRLDEVQARYDECLEHQHEAERTARALLGSEEIASLEIERAALQRSLEDALERWLELGLSHALLQATLSRYERERQPQVISRAAELFSAVTDGRYVQLVAREDDDGRGHGIEAVASGGGRIDAADLSRGTAEQLYLCLRLAFATTFAERAVALPLVLDDVLVNFDPERCHATARAIAAVAEDHQVILFTCHPHIVDSVTATGSAAPQVFELPRS